eukprot:TRINITY_DN2479_c0_g1_i1.p1 TRINITY_DN2479_c0_g1~~TRINITY_DN2479_c0_g1_i1.p1  ORF type:complete len:571 (-),score=148.95 TRINITY_DN2479_c0_g1_i1:60-1772(-)
MADDVDAEQQRDEVAVLQSIYGESDVTVVDTAHLELEVRVALPSEEQEVALIVLDPRSGEHAAGCSVALLPPLALRVTYPKHYPSVEAPEYELSCWFLSGAQLTVVCRQLDELWVTGNHEVVLFRWIQWLSEEMLPFLGITTELPMYESFHKEGVPLDPRVKFTVSDPLAPLSIVIPFLVSYDREEQYKKFMETHHVCTVCLTEHIGTDFLENPGGCRHRFCVDCITNLCNVNIAAGTPNKIVCPERGCGVPLHPNVVQQVVDVKSYRKFESMLLQQSLAGMDDIKWCPTCSTAVIVDKQQNLGVCTNCQNSFCTICYQSWHPGRPCELSEDKLQKLIRREAITRNKNELLAIQTAKDNLFSELMSLKWIAGNVRMCPVCNTFIEKTMGCNHMTCSQCHNEFCYQCGVQVSGYGHFSSSRCILFTYDGSLERPAARPLPVRTPAVMAHIIAQRLAVQNGSAVRRCPKCKFQHVKLSSNNHIRCVNCRIGFCFVCLAVVEGTSHFVGGKCKQHTPIDERPKQTPATAGTETPTEERHMDQAFTVLADEVAQLEDTLYHHGTPAVNARGVHR